MVDFNEILNMCLLVVSDWSVSGVLQGNVLRPLMSLIFISDFTVSCHSKHVSGLFLYTDNAKLFSANSNNLPQSITSVVS